MSEHSEQDPAPEEQSGGRPEGEDHREGAPGYDLDEQSAIHELMEEREGDEEDA